jgi:hypothetical protein
LGTGGQEGGGRVGVEVEPPIRADNGPICGYRLLATHTPNIPFEVSPKWIQWGGGGWRWSPPSGQTTAPSADVGSSLNTRPIFPLR